MSKLWHPLLLLVAKATDKQLTKYVEYLKAENRILRDKLPKRITVTRSERERLVKLGKPLGTAIKELITIVTPRTFARWVSGESSKTKPRKPGRPRTPEEIRQLIIQMARDTGWGYKRILGELKKLRIYSVSRATIARILKENGFDPGPKRGDGTWHDFIQRHIKTVWATDFFTKKVWNHLRYLIREWLEHYHTERPHQGRGNALLTGTGPPSEPVDTISLDEIVCHERLGGLLKHYERKAA